MNYPIIKELTPKYTRNKSYYHKAFTYETETKIYLFSYDTNVAIYNKEKNEVINTWHGYSSTTARHIHDFLLQHNLKTYSKKEWCNMYQDKKAVDLYTLQEENKRLCLSIVRKQVITL